MRSYPIDVFWLGTHETSWLGRTDVPLFVSHRRLSLRRSLPSATCDWALDSGGFTELSMHGRWETTPGAYVAAGRRYRDEIGRLQWAAPQDWMCEPHVLTKTGLTVADHQKRTIDSVVWLRHVAPDVPWIPVLQGWTPDDYLRHADQYERRGIPLDRESVVGIGSVCRRQNLSTTGPLVVRLAADGIRLHGFGVKLTGLAEYGWALTSADSMAWSYAARRSRPLPGCTHGSCANCLRYAMAWRDRALGRLRSQQLSFAL